MGDQGDHTTKNRQQIASIVEKYADRILITNSNPYDEDPDKILADIYNAFYDTDKVLILKNRAKAIDKAFEESVAGDTVLITGKGRQKFIAIKNQKLPHNDVEYVQSIYSDNEI